MTVVDGFTTTTAPWWFVAVLAGVLAIVSTLVGALVSVWSTAASDRRRDDTEKAKDERAAQDAWRGTLRQLSANFIVTTRQCVIAAQAQFVSEQDPNGTTVWRRDATQQRPDLAASFLAYSELVLAADAETGRLARNLMRQVRRYDWASVTVHRADDPMLSYHHPGGGRLLGLARETHSRIRDSSRINAWGHFSSGHPLRDGGRLPAERRTL